MSQPQAMRRRRDHHTTYSPGFFGPRVELFGRRRDRFPARFRPPALGLPRSLVEGPRHLAAEAGAAVARLQAAAGPKGSIAVEQRLVQRITMGATQAELAHIEEVGYSRYLDEQLDYEELDDSELEATLADAFPSLAMSAGDLYRNYDDNPIVPVIELLAATIYRSLYSPRQLFERMVIFWTDHFNIDILSDFAYFLKPVDDRDVVRAHAMGEFPDLVSASAHSPAMLLYLTNDTNVKGHPNENYARELMELHTLGVDNGYTQEDVREVSRCFTGWTLRGPRASFGALEFLFDARAHDTDSKVVLGRDIAAGGGIDDGEKVLSILGKHRNTADFIAYKMLRYLWGYEPKKTAIKKVSKAYRRTDGDIRAMLSAALKKQRMSSATPKLKRPYHLMTSALRALSADVENPYGLFDYLVTAGHLPYTWSPPDGYPDDEVYWSGFILPRWNFASTLFREGRAGIDFDLSFLNTSLSAGQLAKRIDERLLNGTMSKATRTTITDFLNSGPINQQRIQDAVGLAIASPDFQEY